MEELKIRCSAIHKIMAYPNRDELSVGAKTYIKALHKEYNFGIKPEFWSRHIDKGNNCELDTIRLADDVLKWKLPTEMILGNLEQIYHENDYLTGHTDVLTKDILAEVKTSWDGNTFPMYEDDKYNKDYRWQCLGYMAVTGFDRCTLVYGLINTPENMVQDEIRREHWKQDSFWKGDEEDEIVEAVRSRHNIDHIKKTIRLRHWTIDRDEKAIQQIYRRVELCREYWNELNEYIKNK